MSAKLGSPTKVQERLDESLIAGLVIKLGGLVIDGSLKNKLNHALKALQAKSAG